MFFIIFTERKKKQIPASGKGIQLSNFLPNKEKKKRICFNIYKSAYSDNIA